MFRRVEPVQHCGLDDRTSSNAAEPWEDMTRLGPARLSGNPRQCSLNGGVINLCPGLRQNPDWKDRARLMHKCLIGYDDCVAAGDFSCGGALKRIYIGEPIVTDY